MSREAMLPCFKFAESDNQPSEGTEFRTYGHYGSTFWDSFDGEELVLNVCDECLSAHRERLAQHKRFRPINAPRVGMVGKHWVDRPMVPYTGNPDEGDLRIEPEEIGSALPNVEWADNADEVRAYALKLANGEPQ